MLGFDNLNRKLIQKIKSICKHVKNFKFFFVSTQNQTNRNQTMPTTTNRKKSPTNNIRSYRRLPLPARRPCRRRARSKWLIRRTFFALFVCLFMNDLLCIRCFLTINVVIYNPVCSYKKEDEEKKDSNESDKTDGLSLPPPPPAAAAGLNLPPPPATTSSPE